MYDRDDNRVSHVANIANAIMRSVSLNHQIHQIHQMRFIHTLQGEGTPMLREEILLVYDGECPACNAYCQVVRIKDSVGDLRIVDARGNSEVMNEITAQGLDIDQGMVLKMGEQFYYGSDAIHKLALISSRWGIFNRFNYWIFKSKTLANILYPPLRFSRNLLLKMLGKTKINNLKAHLKDKQNDKF
jgi:predicted DCC family thiol-disulfide oxidoreductase YuxK